MEKVDWFHTSQSELI